MKLDSSPRNVPAFPSVVHDAMNDKFLRYMSVQALLYFELNLSVSPPFSVIVLFRNVSFWISNSHRGWA